MSFIKIRFAGNYVETGSTMEKTIEDVFRTINSGFTLANHVWKPQMDMYETPEEIIIIAEIAGVDRDSLDVEISSRAVRIFGKRVQFSRVPDMNFRLAEIQYGKFERTLFLPAHIDTDLVSSSYSNGFLTIRLVKLLEKKICKIQID